MSTLLNQKKQQQQMQQQNQETSNQLQNTGTNKYGFRKDIFTNQYRDKFKQLQNNLVQSKVQYKYEQEKQEFDSKKSYRQMMEVINKFKPKYKQMEKAFQAVDFRKLRYLKREQELEQQRVQTALEEKQQRRRLSIKRKKQAQRPISLNQEYLKDQQQEYLQQALQKSLKEQEQQAMQSMQFEKNFLKFSDDSQQKEDIYRQTIKQKIQEDQEQKQESQGILRYSPTCTQQNFWKKSNKFNMSIMTQDNSYFQQQDYVPMQSLQSLNSQNSQSHKNKFIPIQQTPKTSQSQVRPKHSKNIKSVCDSAYKTNYSTNQSNYQNSDRKTQQSFSNYNPGYPQFQKYNNTPNQKLQNLMKNTKLHESKSEYFHQQQQQQQQQPQTSNFQSQQASYNHHQMKSMQSNFSNNSGFIYTDQEFKRKFLLSQQKYMRDYKQKQIDKQRQLELEQYELENQRLKTSNNNDKSNIYSHNHRSSFQQTRNSVQSNTNMSSQTPRI